MQSECAAMLTQAREEVIPRYADCLASSSLRTTRRWRGLRSTGTNPMLYTNSGLNMSTGDRHHLAQALAAYIEEVRFPTESKAPNQALGIPLTPRSVA